MSALQNFSRRGFLRASAAAAGGVMIGFQLGSQESASAASSKLNAFVHVGTDDIVTLFIHKAEMGQGTVTSLSMLLAEELECDWKKIRTEFPGREPRVRAHAGRVRQRERAHLVRFAAPRGCRGARNAGAGRGAAMGRCSLGLPRGEQRRGQHRHQCAADLRQSGRGRIQTDGAGQPRR